MASDHMIDVSDWCCRKKHLEVPDTDPSSSNKEKISSDIRPGEAAAAVSNTVHFPGSRRMLLCYHHGYMDFVW